MTIFFQRFFDILFSGMALAFLAPLFILIIIVLKFTGEGEIFFFQERIGRKKKKIRLFKFATMIKNSENIGTGTVTLKNDTRILPLGHFLRKTKINELPQLINIFIGDMSIIGPRPQTERCFDAFPEESQAIITLVKPGLSGIGSIVFRDEEEMMHGHQDPDKFYDKTIMPFKGKLEQWYVQNNNIYYYFLLIFMTVLVVFSSKITFVWRFISDLPRPNKELSKYLF